MTPALDGPDLLCLDGPRPPETPREAPRGPQNNAATTARLLAAWARQRCPHLKPDGKCRRQRGGCRLLAAAPSRCQWAERGPAFLAPEPVHRAYLAVAGGPWWGRRSAESMGEPVCAPRPPRVCPKCGASLARRRRLCDRCRDEARRVTKRLAQRRWRHSMRTSRAR